ncbi:MAG: 50S ribosomal protein L4 [Clostridia bacterium]|nr:50S ribosomal protein L4 [Clostridia bacterium]
MPNVAVVDMTGKQVGDIALSDAIFGIKPNAVVMHMAVVNFLANQRQGTQSTLTRSEVSGGGRKPWRQKGTGHARQGSTRSPQWRHGGIALGPKPRDYSYSLNKKVRKLALKSALSDKVQGGNLIVLDSLALDSYKTKTVVDCLKAIGTGKKTLIVLEDNNPFAVRSAANIAGVKTAQVNTINTYDILNANTLVIVKGAVAKIEEVYA